MPLTATQLRNEAETAKDAWRASIEEKKPEAEREVCRVAFMDAKAAIEEFETLLAAEKAFDADHPTPSQLRDASDASKSDDVPAVSKDKANQTPNNYIEVVGKRGLQWLPVASEKTEGYIKRFPAAVQHPSIIARYHPSSDLFKAAEQQMQAYAMYLRKGAMWMAQNEPDLAKALKALQEGTDSEGGYLVPTDQRTDLIFDPGAPGGVTRPQSSVTSTTRDAGTMPTWTDGDWIAIAEEATPSNTDPVMGQVAFTARKSGANITLSDELLADEAVNLPAQMSARWNALKGRFEDEQAVAGDGSTEPLGLRTTGAGQGDIADITDLLTLAAPTVAEIVAAYFELPAQFRATAIWHTSSSFMGRVAGIESANGGVSFLRELFAAPEMTLLGKPVVLWDGTGWDDAATIGANEEVGAFGDFRNHYLWVDRVGMTIRRFDETSAASDQVLFRARARMDGLFTENNAFRILKGAAS